MALGIGLAGCVPVYQADLPRGEHLVTSYGRLFGIAGTRYNNAEAALATCPNGYIVLDERLGIDDNGAYRRWRYGCLAP